MSELNFEAGKLEQARMFAERAVEYEHGNEELLKAINEVVEDLNRS